LAELFFSALKTERVHCTVYATKARAKRDVILYIEGFKKQPPPKTPLRLLTASISGVITQTKLLSEKSVAPHFRLGEKGGPSRHNRYLGRKCSHQLNYLSKRK
jgi:hypothetical protein